MTTADDPTKEKPAKKAPAKAPAKMNIAAMTRQLILKKTGQKPLEKSMSTLPHVPSGSIIIDNLIGGSKAQDGKGSICPGYPRRKITEIYGPESSGKTTVALAAVAKVQRAGGTAMFLDFEHALHHGYAQQIGVKFDDTFMLYAPDTMEEGFTMMLIAIMTGVDIIVVDSVAAMVPAAELDKKISDAAKVGVVAAKMAINLPKFALWLAKHPQEGGEVKKPVKGALGTALVFLNQERAVISTGGGHGPETNSAGGKALKFFAYYRLRLTRISSDMIERKDPLTGKKRKFPYGNQTSVKVVKAKADAKQGMSANIFIRYGYGVDDVYSVIETGVVNGLVQKEGAYYAYGGERVQSRDKFRALLLANPKLYDELKTKVVNAIVSMAPTAVADEELSEEDALLEGMESELDGLDVALGKTEEELVIEAEDAVEPEGEDAGVADGE